MLELMKFKWLLIKYKTIFADVLEDFTLEKVEGKQIILQDKNKNEFRIGLTGDYVNCYYKDEITERKITFKLLDKKDDLSNIKVVEIKKENRPNGCIIEEITRTFVMSKFPKEERVLMDLVSQSYVFNKNIEFNKFYDIEYREANSLFQTTFESHMKITSPESVEILLNGEDISTIYQDVEGKNVISRIFDLYNGNITKRNEQDYKVNGLNMIEMKKIGYKEISGITEQENEICGASLLPKNSEEHVKKYIPTRIYAPTFSGRVMVGGGDRSIFVNIKGNAHVNVAGNKFVTVKNEFVRRLLRKITGKE